MQRGTQVFVTGAKRFTGTVLAAGKDSLVIEVAPGVSATLRRDIASTKPLQWRCAGLPVEVSAKPANNISGDCKPASIEGPKRVVNLKEFRKRLFALEKRTRKL